MDIAGLTVDGVVVVFFWGVSLRFLYFISIITPMNIVFNDEYNILESCWARGA